MIIGRQLVDEYYEDEKLYSTGDDYLDEMLEKAFCDGYEYAQREFAEEEDNQDKRGMSTGGKVAVAAGTAAALTAAYFGGRKLQKNHINKLIDKSSGGTDEYRKLVAKQRKLEQGNALDRFGRKVSNKVKDVFSRKKGAYKSEPDVY